MCSIGGLWPRHTHIYIPPYVVVAGPRLPI